MAERAPAPDQAARDRITGDLAATLFVEAGAGSGKTTALIDRILALVGSGAVELRSLAAITFTDKAAAELRDRLRRQLEERAEAGGHSEPVARYQRALGQLDGAAVETLHAFAQRLLAEHPIEAGLPPRLEVLDEVSSGASFEERWRSFLDALLADASLERTWPLFLACGGREDALRGVADTFNRNWDLLEERVGEPDGDVPAVSTLVAPLLEELRGLCATVCSDPGDRLRQRLDEVEAWVDQVATITDDLDLLAVLAGDAEPEVPSFRVGTVGRKANYACDVKELRADLSAAGDRLVDGVRAQVAEVCFERLGARISTFVLGAARERQAAGRLEFHDLLVLAAELVRHPHHGPAVRARLHERYERLLLDESQDTDPIQLELAVRIAAADPGGAASGSAGWAELDVTPGQLFLVGDPKQSIYRFRRADVAVFLDARRRFGSDTGGLVELTANFRTTRPVIDWVNTVFASLLAPVAGTEPRLASQPAYVALEAVRDGAPVGPPVCVLGRDEHPAGARAAAVHAAEAADVASTVSRILAERWAVGDGEAPSSWRPARLGDITVLLPTRTSLPFLEDAFEAARIPYRTESSSLVYATRAVRDLLLVARAVDDPTDALALVSALRTPLLGCGDDDLFRFKVRHGGRWNYLAPQPGDVPRDDPVLRALDYLRGLYGERHWLAVSEVLDRIATDRRAFELGIADGRPRDVWRRLRFVIDQARAWHEAVGGNLRQYLRWVDAQVAEGTRVEEAVLPETDDDAVRIMTVHAAKGLEFPVTIVSGLTTKPSNRRPQVVFPPDGGVAYQLGNGLVSPVFAAWADAEARLALDERIRLLYVACTRARDHLVVSLHRSARSGTPDASRLTNAELLVTGIGDLLDRLPDGPGGHGPSTVAVPSPPSAPEPFEQWSAELGAALARASRPTTVAATALAGDGDLATPGETREGLEKRGPDLDGSPWLRGRYGSAVGRAVHGTLQVVDLRTGAGVEAAVAAQCEAEAVVDRAADVRRLVDAALGSPTIAEAAAARHWRELYVCVPVGDRLLEGYVDLLFRRPGSGLVVVDYKTASTADPAELDRRVEGYRHQGAAYALAVGEATGEPVDEVVFVFLTPDGAVERRLPDLAGSVTRVQLLVDAGAETTVG